MRKKLLSGVLVAVVTAMGMYSTGVSAEPASPTFSVAVHIEYPDGFVYDHAFVSGIPASQLSASLAACGKNHWGGPGVRFHCYAIAE